MSYAPKSGAWNFFHEAPATIDRTEILVAGRAAIYLMSAIAHQGFGRSGFEAESVNLNVPRTAMSLLGEALHPTERFASLLRPDVRLRTKSVRGRS